MLSELPRNNWDPLNFRVKTVGRFVSLRKHWQTSQQIKEVEQDRYVDLARRSSLKSVRFRESLALITRSERGNDSLRHSFRRLQLGGGSNPFEKFYVPFCSTRRWA